MSPAEIAECDTKFGAWAACRCSVNVTNRISSFEGGSANGLATLVDNGRVAT